MKQSNKNDVLCSSIFNLSFPIGVCSPLTFKLINGCLNFSFRLHIKFLTIVNCLSLLWNFVRFFLFVYRRSIKYATNQISEKKNKRYSDRKICHFNVSCHGNAFIGGYNISDICNQTIVVIVNYY